MKRRTLVVGIGNPLRGDDAFGAEIAARLGIHRGDFTEVIAVHQLLPELADDLRHCDVVVFIDASSSGVSGEWKCERIYPGDRAPESSAHRMDPEAILHLTQRIYGRCPEAWLVSVTGESFEHGAPLSAKIEAAIPAVLSCLHERISDSASRP